jgi:hypothetical protein
MNAHAGIRIGEGKGENSRSGQHSARGGKLNGKNYYLKKKIDFLRSIYFKPLGHRKENSAVTVCPKSYLLGTVAVIIPPRGAINLAALLL